MNTPFIFGSIQSLFFALLLISKKEKKKCDRILLFWFLYFCLHLLFPAFVFYNYPDHISFSGMDIGFLAAHVVFLHHYISSLSGMKSSPMKSLVLFLFIVVGTLLFVSPYLFMGLENRTLLMTGQAGFPIIMLAGTLFLIGATSYYLYSSIVIMKRFRIDMHEQISNTDGMMMMWIDVLIVGFIVLYSSVLILFLLMLFTSLQPHLADYGFYLGLVLFLFWMGFSAVRQGAVFLPDTKPADEKNSDNVLKSPTEKERLFGEKVKEFTEGEKIYLRNEIRMSQMAEMLSVSPQYLSFVLNSVIEMSFYDFINSYRINEVCSRIESGDIKEQTILSLALESGFNSKATFNRIFKKQKGMNPSEYIKKASQVIS